MTGTGDTAQALYFQALRKHRDKDYPAAVDLLEQALQEDPRLYDAWEALGVVYEKMERLDDAIRAMEKLAEINPEEVMAHTNLSRFYMKKGWKEKAEEAQGRARMLGWKKDLAQPAAGGAPELSQASAAPPAGEQPVSLVNFLEPRAAPPAAPPPPNPAALQRKIAQFKAVLQANPEDTLSRFTLGRTYLQAGQPAEAVTVLEELLQKKDDYTAAYVLLGEAYEKSGKLARALRTYHKGLEVAERKGDLHPRNQIQERLQQLQG